MPIQLHRCGKGRSQRIGVAVEHRTQLVHVPRRKRRAHGLAQLSELAGRFLQLGSSGFQLFLRGADALGKRAGTPLQVAAHGTQGRGAGRKRAGHVGDLFRKIVELGLDGSVVLVRKLVDAGLGLIGEFLRFRALGLRLVGRAADIIGGRTHVVGQIRLGLGRIAQLANEHIKVGRLVRVGFLVLLGKLIHLVGDGIELSGDIVNVAGAVVQVVRRITSNNRGGIESLVDGLRNTVKARSCLGNSFAQSAVGALHGLGHAGNGILRLVGRLQHLGSRASSLAKQVCRTGNQLLGCAKHLGVRLQHLRRLRHLGSQCVHMVGQHPKLPFRTRSVGVLHKRAGNVQANFGQRLRECLVHHVRGLIGALVGKLRRHNVLLLVAVIQQAGMLNVVRVERHHILAEALGNDNSGIVLARACPIKGIVFVGEHPVHLLGCTQRRNHLLAHVHLQGNQVGLVAFIVVHNRNLQVPGVLEHIPAGQNVVPAED